MTLPSMGALRTSITARLTMLFTAAVILLLVVHGAYHYRSLAMQLEGRQAATLTEKLTTVRSRLVHHESADLIAGNAHDVMEVLTGHSDLFLVIRDGSGRVMAASHVEDQRPRPPATTSATEDVKWRALQIDYRTVRVLAPLGMAGTPVSVELTVDTTRDIQILRAFVREVGLGMLVGVLIAGAMAFLIARHGLTALNTFARLANEITVSRLDERLDSNSVPWELRELAAAYNGMLERLGMSFRRLVDFSADLAHELRTPIHNLLGQTQVALSRARSAAEYRQVLESNVEEYERLSRMIRDMLFLAQADNAQLPLCRETIELGDTVRKVVSLFEAAAEERGVAIVTVGEARVQADRIMLERALANLLSNALRHATPGSEISVATERSGADVTIATTNHGKCIPDSVVSRLFDRFFRGDRLRHGEGIGLGLAIVKSIIELHGGSVAVSSDLSGKTQFTMRIPAAAEANGQPGDVDSSRDANRAFLAAPQRPGARVLH